MSHEHDQTAYLREGALSDLLQDLVVLLPRHEGAQHRLRFHGCRGEQTILRHGYYIFNAM